MPSTKKMKEVSPTNWKKKTAPTHKGGNGNKPANPGKVQGKELSYSWIEMRQVETLKHVDFAMKSTPDSLRFDVKGGKNWGEKKAREARS